MTDEPSTPPSRPAPPPTPPSRPAPPSTPPATAPSGAPGNDAVRYSTTLPPLDGEGQARRAIIAVSLCLCGATPSFMLAAGEFSLPGMLVGVAIFAVAMVAISWNGWFQRLARQAYLKSSLSIVYVGRVVLSIAWPFVVFLDGFPGLFAVQIVTTLGFGEPGADDLSLFGPVSGPLGTLLTVLVQGVILNALLLLVAMGIWVLQLFVRGPLPERTEGTTFCRQCGYCRDGFPPDHPCPECGDTRPALPWTPSWVDRWTMTRLVGTAIVVPVMIGGTAITIFMVLGPL